MFGFSVTEFAIDLLQTLFERWGYWIVFLGPLVENTLLLGLFVPGAFVLILAGISAGQGLIDLPLAIVLAIVGTSIGDTLSYCAGRFGWQRVMKRADDLPYMGTVRAAMLRRTATFVLSYHFLGYTRLVGPAAAGVVRVPFRKWWPLDAIGATLWVTSYMVGGYVLARIGISLETAQRHAEQIDKALLVVAIVGAAAFFFVQWRKQRREALAAVAPAVTTVPAAEEGVGEEAGSGRRSG